MASRAELLETRAALNAATRASEPWEESYKQDRPTFRRLLAQEQALQLGLSEYLFTLAHLRLGDLINGGEVRAKLHAALVVGKDDWATKREETILIEVMLPHIEELMGIGAAAGAAKAGVPADLPVLETLLLANARKSTAQLVSGVTDTTRDIIQKTIQSSIDRGDNLATMTERLKETVNNPVRAEMIAQTETVNAYQSGLEQFAEETGAVSKEWEAKAGACVICAPLHGKTLPIDEAFETAVGPRMRPAVHPRCRCGLIYNYDH